MPSSSRISSNSLAKEVGFALRSLATSFSKAVIAQTAMHLDWRTNDFNRGCL